ncbi:MAG: hypothetical protein WDW19_00535 [Neisseriaceae bacterium]
MSTSLRIFLLFFLVFCSPFVVAKTYLCINLEGEKVYTDKPSGGNCSISQLEALNTYTAPLFSTKSATSKNTKKFASGIHKTGFSRKATAANTSTEFLVSAPTQIRRDETRKQILTNELVNEVQALRSVQQQIQLSHSSFSKNKQVQQFELQALERQQNIEAISQELARLK